MTHCASEKYGMKKRRAAALLRSQLTVRSQRAAQSKQSGRIQLLSSFPFLRSQQCHLGSKTGSFHAQHPAARLRAHLCERSQRKNAQTAWKTAAIYTFAALVYPLTAYSSSRSHHCASEKDATRRRTSAQGGRKPAAFPRRLRGRCSPRAAGADFRR